MAEIVKGVYEVGVKDWDRRLFDELIPLPDGTSYNSYFIRGSEKTALLDTVDPTKTALLLEHLEQAGVKHIDYIISHHAEQDHSGSIPAILAKHSGAKVLTNEKCKVLLTQMLDIREQQIETVADGEERQLGGKTLKFIFTPWVHWPETMVTYLKEDRILFTCDFLGSHYAPPTMYVQDEGIAYESAKRYYAEIMMPFRAPIRKNIEKIRPLDIGLIAPSHGFIYNRPAFIFDAYADWTGDAVKNEVIVAYNSMHGSTRRMVEYFDDALARRGVAVKQFNLAGTDIGKLAIALVDAATIVLGCSQVLAGAHPNVAHAAFIANALRPKIRFASIIGSYLWGGKMTEQLVGMMPNLKVEVLEPVLIKGYPREAEFGELERLAQEIKAKHHAIGIL
jgi:flavorubredoxin